MPSANLSSPPESAPQLPLSYRSPAKALTWDALVLPDTVKFRLRRVVARWRSKSLVLKQWGLGERMKGDGLVCLFSGAPGTGKSVAAQLIADELGIPLYRVNLAGIISKYIGETEKNLALILDAAEQHGVALCFDEADAVFSKRSSDPKGSGDHSHNQQVAYLLDRIERYRGLVFLTTNHASTMDEAFRRRFAVSIEFELPCESDRARIWQLSLSRAPIAAEIEWNAFAKWKLSGGVIQKIAYNAAASAACDESPITSAHLKAALDEELDALGILH